MKYYNFFFAGVFHILSTVPNTVTSFTISSLPARLVGSNLSPYDVSQKRSFAHETRCWGKKSNKSSKKKKTVSSKGGGFGGGFSSTDGGSAAAVIGSAPSWSKSFPFAGTVLPGYVSPQKTVAQNEIVKPDYAETQVPKASRALLPWVIEVKTDEEIERMREAGKLARSVLDLAGRQVREGITTNEIDEIVHKATIDAGAYPSPLNYHGFPKSCCTSVNEVICHGIPDSRELVKGDIINIDITVYLNGYHGDCSEMFVVGDGTDDYEPDQSTKDLLQATYDCWVQALNIVKPGNFYKDIGGIIEDHVTPLGYSSVRQFCGHGIGSVFHTNPNILHYKNNEPNGEMAPGHTFTIEPMICEGSAKALSWPDNWTATTSDGKRSAQFEHTLLVTEDGVEALTGKNMDSPVQFWEKESNFHKGIWLGTSADAKKRQDEINAKNL